MGEHVLALLNVAVVIFDGNSIPFVCSTITSY